MRSTLTSPVAAAGLLGGYATARFSGKRHLGEAALLAERRRGAAVGLISL